MVNIHIVNPKRRVGCSESHRLPLKALLAKPTGRRPAPGVCLPGLVRVHFCIHEHPLIFDLWLLFLWLFLFAIFRFLNRAPIEVRLETVILIGVLKRFAFKHGTEPIHPEKWIRSSVAQNSTLVTEQIEDGGCKQR